MQTPEHDVGANPSAHPQVPGRVLTPSQLNAEAQVVLEENFGLVWIEGEISNLARPGSGHWYFTLKDARAQVRCAMFRGRNARVRFAPENGMKVLARARVSLYPARGEFQLVVDAIEPAGEGALRLAFEQLRRALAAEGLFDDDRKRALPARPTHIAVITSPTGAAVRDVLSVLARRWPLARVTLVPTQVQGEAATAGIVAAFGRLTRLCEQDPDGAPDLVIAGRGGGSLEDLWCFNEEAVARAIAAAPIPVVSAVGHETDYTIADFVADLRAPTPSAAAELATPDSAAFAAQLTRTSTRLRDVMRATIRARSETISARRARLRHPNQLLRDRSQRVDELELRLTRRLDGRRTLAQSRLDALRARLELVSPTRRLRLSGERLRTLTQRLQRSGGERLTAARGDAVQALADQLLRARIRDQDLRSRRLARATALLDALSPLRVVDRGYALVLRPGADADSRAELIRDPEAVTPAETLHLRMALGTLAVTAVATVAEAPAVSARDSEDI